MKLNIVLVSSYYLFPQFHILLSTIFLFFVSSIETMDEFAQVIH